MIALFAVTAFLVLAVVGTVGKALFDDWRVRQAVRPAAPTVPSGSRLRP
jgi:hypothetical protein